MIYTKDKWAVRMGRYIIITSGHFQFLFFCCCLFERELGTPARPLEQMQTIRLMTFNNELSNLTLIVVTGDFIKRAPG